MKLYAQKEGEQREEIEFFTDPVSVFGSFKVKKGVTFPVL